MAEDDLDQVVVIERAFQSPWSRDMFLQELRQGRVGEARVVANGDEVLGYILSWFVADEVHIVNLAVHGKVAPAWNRPAAARRHVHRRAGSFAPHRDAGGAHPQPCRGAAL